MQFYLFKDGKQLEKLITFEDDASTSASGTTFTDSIPSINKMVVDEKCGDLIGLFLKQYFECYDSDNREPLANAYHENAILSMQASFPKGILDSDPVAKSYTQDSRNLQLGHIRENSQIRDRHLHQKKLQVVGFLDKLPKTQHDFDSFTLDVPFATERLITFTVSGAFREREVTPQPIRHFSRCCTVLPEVRPDGTTSLCIINDSLLIKNATREQSERSNKMFSDKLSLFSQQTGMNIEWTKK